MGQRLIEGTLPNIARELRTLNLNLAELMVNRIAPAPEKPAPDASIELLVSLILLRNDNTDYFGPDRCDCRLEPENEGHVCATCLANHTINERVNRMSKPELAALFASLAEHGEPSATIIQKL
jgi:hypothetical protein